MCQIKQNLLVQSLKLPLSKYEVKTVENISRDPIHRTPETPPTPYCKASATPFPQFARRLTKQAAEPSHHNARGERGTLLLNT